MPFNDATAMLASCLTSNIEALFDDGLGMRGRGAMEQKALVADPAILHRNPFSREEIRCPEGGVLDSMYRGNLEGLEVACVLMELGDGVLDLVFNPPEFLAALRMRRQADLSDRNPSVRLGTRVPVFGVAQL
jgi:hypothetical protein